MKEKIIKDIDDFKKRLTKAKNDNNRADEVRTTPTASSNEQ